MGKGRILIVEDDGIIANNLLDILDDAGYEAAIAATGDAAIRMAGETAPDLVLMDIRLKGGMDGIDAADRIREKRDVPLIFLTAFVEAGLVQRAKNTRPRGYLLKPFRENELMAAIEVALHAHALDETRRQMEARAQHSRKMQGLSAMAGAIGHHLNNMMMVVLGYAELIEEQTEAGSPLNAHAREILKICGRARKLTRQIVIYKGDYPSSHQPVDLLEIIADISEILSVSTPPACPLHYDLPDRMPPISADPGALREMLVNLVINAGEALPPDNGGRITLSAGVEAMDRPFMTEACPDEELPPGRYAFLEVSDTGVGMSQETLGRALDPFFSTKMLGRGLGLSAARGIVKNHGGGIRVWSAEGEGTRVRVLFPVAAGD